MLSGQAINLKILEKVASALGELNTNMLYVGGAVMSLYVTDEGAEQPRPTNDIDISVQISSYSQMENLRQQLVARRIYPAPTSSVMYRYTYEDILIDFIPDEETPLGPTNSWLKPGFKNAYRVKIGKTEINIMPVSLFIATKWEAFKSRGRDPRTSHDFEDIIYTIDNNLNLVDDVKKAEIEVQHFLKKMSEEILFHPSSNEIIECHLDPVTLEERKKIIVDKLEKIHKII